MVEYSSSNRWAASSHDHRRGVPATAPGNGRTSTSSFSSSTWSDVGGFEEWSMMPSFCRSQHGSSFRHAQYCLPTMFASARSAMRSIVPRFSVAPNSGGSRPDGLGRPR